MIVYKFLTNTSKIWFAFSNTELGDNLPSTIEGKAVKWELVETIDTSNPLQDFSADFLNRIKKEGFYIPNWTIEYKQERTTRK